MKIFDKRPLSLILCILLVAFVIFSYGDKTVRISLLSIAILLILISIFVKNLLKSQRFTLIIASLLIIFSSVASYVYFDSWYYADKRFSESVTVEGVVENVNFDEKPMTMVVSANSVNDQRLSGYKILVKIGNNDMTNITPGVKVKFNADLNGFETSDGFDSASYYYSQGFSAKADNVENIEVLSQGQLSPFYRITKYRESLARRLVMYSDKTSGGLLAALLIGERSFLDGEIKLNFSRIGITHILALSGLHVAILCYGFSRLLSLLRVNKKIRKVAEILFTTGYMVLTGLPISVVRAGLMLIISSLLFLLSSSKDAITNLFISVTLIILFAPYSVFDLSLWLSAFATLGIIAFSEITEKLKKNDTGTLKRFLISVGTPFLSSFFAITATLLISYISFESLSLLSIISTAIFSPVFLVLIYVGVFFLLTAPLIPLGNLVSLFCGFITNLAATFSSFKYALLSTDFFVTEFLIVISSLFFLLFLLLKVKRRGIAVLLSVCLFASTFISAWAFTSFSFNDFAFEYNETEERERILIKNNAEVTLIEVSNLNDNVVYETLDYLKKENVLYLDNYLITDYSENSNIALDALLSRIKINSIYVPTPKSESMTASYERVLTVLSGYSVKTVTYQEEDSLSFSDFTFFPICYTEKGKCAFTILYRDDFYIYISSDMLSGSTKSHALKVMNGAKTVIVGSKNATNSRLEFIYKLEKETSLIYNKKSGLPDEILAYYENRITVDPNGSIGLYVE